MHYDLIIVGGGLVGRSIACALRDSGLKIALIDASPTERPDPRLIALNYGSFSFLTKIGVWPAIEKHAAAIHEVHVSRRGHFGTTRMTNQQIHLPALGYVVPAQEINLALGEVLKQCGENYSELRPATVKAISLQEETRLSLESANTRLEMTGDLIIGADGTHSTIRQLLDFETENVDYQQSAIVTTAHLSRSHQHIAYERFIDEGAIAMLPLQRPSWECASIWTAPTPKINELMHLSDEDYRRTLQAEFGYRLGRLQGISTRHVFPLHFIRVKNSLKKNVLLIGNAAHTIHPVGAQGLNLALYEIAHLTQQILALREKNQSLSAGISPDIIPKQPKTNLFLAHRLNPLFSSQAWGINVARQLGMISLDLCPPLKNQFSRLLAMESVKWI